ncbi:hypothetical protein JW897_21935 [Chromobacterium alkanivorans]|uniref:hypothetical protein n=1 Tax=Chromobacterium alkanivorans TaxID=1071719 RepID=UPI001966F971|nr:hypothetical protein [Chromobacterium alkanivorans]MBN3006408.1 hypothetical protein [Chromobacterium alkanivorans]
MLKCMVQVLVASSVLCVSFVKADESTVIQGSSKFEVQGIIKPAACNVNFSEGNVWDYGVIQEREIAEYPEAMFRKEGGVHNMNIKCESPASVRVRFVDAVGREGSSDKRTFGFNKTADGKEIGFHYFQFKGDMKAFDESGGEIAGVAYGVSEDQGVWKKAGSDWVENLHYYTPIDGDSVPVSFKTLTAGIASKIAIKKGLGLTDEQEFRGVVTMELYY